MSSAASTDTVGFQKGIAPFVKFCKLLNSKNQEVFGVLFVKLSSHKKVSAGVGRVAPQIGFAGKFLRKVFARELFAATPSTSIWSGRQKISKAISALLNEANQ